MKPAVVFDDVSKRYQLGLTRASLPSLLSRSIRRWLGASAGRASAGQYLWAVRGVSFELHRGESLALVGQNGAGKTTILKLLAGITHPTSGSLEVNGQLSALIELGAGFHPDLTGRENVYLNGTILGLRRKEIDRRFDEIVAFSELERFIDTPVKRYSSGMTVRLGFAVAACIEPDILLVDEVLAVGDASFRLKCMERIQSLLRNGTGLIFVSHNFYLVRAICASAIYLDQGQVKQFGNTRDVIETYERDLHAERARRYALEQVQSDDGPAVVDILRVDVTAADGSRTEVLQSSQPARIVVHYIAYQPLDSVSVAAHITRSDGVTCCMMRTSLDGLRFSLPRGRGAISVTLDPLQLISGNYYAEGHFLNATDSMDIAGASSDWFSVSGSELSYEERSGVFRPRTYWQQQLLPAEDGALSEASVL